MTIADGESGASVRTKLNASQSRLITQETAFPADEAQRIVGKAAALESGTNGTGGTYMFTGRPAVDGAVAGVSIWAPAQTAKLKVYRATDVGGTAYTLAYEVSLVLSTGLNEFSVAAGTLGEYLVQEGDVLGLHMPSGINFASPAAGSVGYTYVAGDLTAAQTYDNVGAISTVELQARITINAASSANVVKSAAVSETLARNFSVGVLSPAAPATLQYMPTGRTYAWDWEFKSAALLNAITLSSQIVGVGKLVVLEPYLGGYRTARSVQLRFGAGVSTLTAGVDFPSDVVVPKGGLVAFKNGVVSSVHQNILDNIQRSRVFFGDATDGIFPSYDWPSGAEANSGIVFNNAAYQMRFDFSEALDPASLIAPQYLVREKFGQTHGPVTMLGDAWTKGAGFMSSGATGIANGLEWAGGETNLTDFECRWRFEFTAAGTEVYFYKRPFVASQGSVVGFSMTTGDVTIYNMLPSSGVLGTVNTARVCTVPLVVDREYVVTFAKNYRDWSFTITDAVTGASDMVSWDGDASAAAGLGYGHPGIAVASGSVDLMEFAAWSGRKSPNVLLFGDSITEGTGGTTIQDTWGYMVCEQANGLESPRGGDTAPNIARRVINEIAAFPAVRYAIFLAGTNDTDMTLWQRAIDRVAEACQTFGVVPVFGTLPPEAADTNPVLVQNPYIRSSGYRYIDFARALTVGGDGETRDAAKFADTLHPNDAGHLAMFERVRLDLPEIFD